MESPLFCVYIITNKPNGTLYIGMTDDLHRRMYEHQNGLVDGFSKRYGLNRLVYLETTEDFYSALTREKQLKKWNRVWKIRLIRKTNPDWRDLYTELVC